MANDDKAIDPPFDRLAAFADSLPDLVTKIDRYSPESFGNRLIQWKWDDVILSLVRDRGVWEVLVGLRVGGGDLAEPDFRVSFPAPYLMLVIEQDVLGSRPTDEAIVEYFITHWQETRRYVVDNSPFLVKRLVDKAVARLCPWIVTR